MHIRHKHPEVSNAAINIERQKARWTSEKERILAHKEASLIINGTWNINLAPVEGIKGKCRASAYKRLAEELVQGMSGGDQDSPQPDDEMLHGRSDATTLHPLTDTHVGSPGLETSKVSSDMQGGPVNRVFWSSSLLHRSLRGD